MVRQSIILHRNALGIECIRFNQVCTSLKISAVNATYHMRSCQRQDIVATLEIVAMVSKSASPEICFTEMRLLDHRSHCSIKDQNAIFADFIERNACVPSLIFRQPDDVFNLTVCLILALELLNDTHGLFHFPLVMEIHFKMHTLSTDMIQQRLQLIECHPTSHDALAAIEDLPIQVIPFWRTALRLTDSWCPLDGVQFVDFQQRIEMMHGPHTIEMIEGIFDLLTLFTNERLDKTAIVIDTDHRGNIALQLRHLAWCP